MRVAIAEDDANYALHLKSLLQRFQEETGVTVESAVFSDGAELAAHYTSDWDVLLLDVDMPNLDGLATARWVRQRDPQPLLLNREGELVRVPLSHLLAA